MVNTNSTPAERSHYSRFINHPRNPWITAGALFACAFGSAVIAHRKSEEKRADGPPSQVSKDSVGPMHEPIREDPLLSESNSTQSPAQILPDGTELLNGRLVISNTAKTPSAETQQILDCLPWIKSLTADPTIWRRTGADFFPDAGLIKDPDRHKKGDAHTTYQTTVISPAGMLVEVKLFHSRAATYSVLGLASEAKISITSDNDSSISSDELSRDLMEIIIELEEKVDHIYREREQRAKELLRSFEQWTTDMSVIWSAYHSDDANSPSRRVIYLTRYPYRILFEKHSEDSIVNPGSSVDNYNITLRQYDVDQTLLAQLTPTFSETFNAPMPQHIVFELTYSDCFRSSPDTPAADWPKRCFEHIAQLMVSPQGEHK